MSTTIDVVKQIRERAAEEQQLGRSGFFLEQIADYTEQLQSKVDTLRGALELIERHGTYGGCKPHVLKIARDALAKTKA